MLRFALPCLTTLVVSTLAAQAPSHRVDSLIAQTLHGDEQARSALGTIGRGLLSDAGSHRGSAEEQRQAAKVALALAAPLSPPEAAVTRREVEWRGGAVRALLAALSIDSADVWSASHLAAIAPYPYIWTKPEQELRHLRALVSHAREVPPDLRATRIELEIELGFPDSAQRAFDALPTGALSGAAAGHLLAEIAFAKGNDSAARKAYWQGAAAIHDSSDAATYSGELLWIATAKEFSEWNALAPEGSARRQWLEVFWNRRDLRDARPPGSRLPEQFLRWRLALHDYRWENDGSTALGIPIPRGADQDYNDGDILFPKDESGDLAYGDYYLPKSRVLDDRGRFVLRLGKPTHVYLPPGVTNASLQNIVWATPEGPVMIGFSTPTIKVKGQKPMPIVRFGMLARSYPAGDLMTVCNVDPRLCVVAGQVNMSNQGRVLGLTPGGAVKHVRVDYARMRSVAEHTEGNRRTFNRELKAILQAFGLPGGRILVPFAVPGESIPGRDGAAPRLVTLQMQSMIGDSVAGTLVGAHDTTLRYRTTVNEKQFLQGYATFPAPVGTWSTSIVLGDSITLSRGTGMKFDGIPVVPAHPDRLTLSDLIPGRASSGLAWHDGSDVIPLNPTNAWRRDEPLILSYYLLGTGSGRRYRTTFEIWKAKGHPTKPSLTLSGEAELATGERLIAREISLRELPTGDYRIVVRVHDSVTGEEAVRERLIVVAR